MACAKDDKQPPKSEPSLHTRKKTAASPTFRCRKRGRTTDAVACPECAVVLASRSTGVNHLVTTHGYDHQEALRLLQRAPPASPGDRTAPQKCPYCPRICPSVASVNRHVKQHDKMQMPYFQACSI
ncbi:Zinc finger C2H2-like protein [Perkinsela sp. CCAP 1560/4]|nr:Zinc finger C2H2-like protein [Perkinsela sp. CCAP 1560/4]|eukprot:KNH06250.1 Zinc finger C2H2-like protein [Perkinsela sp. CCAP 1560/4]